MHLTDTRSEAVLLGQVRHHQTSYLSDADKRNTFDVEKYMSRRLALKADEEYDVYEIDDVDLDEEDLTDDT